VAGEFPAVAPRGDGVADPGVGVVAVEGDAVEAAAGVAARLGGEMVEHDRFGTATVRLDDSDIHFATTRRERYPEPYDALKGLTRGRTPTLEDIHAFIRELDISPEVREELLALVPERYIGIAPALARLGP